MNVDERQSIVIYFQKNFFRPATFKASWHYSDAKLELPGSFEALNVTIPKMTIPKWHGLVSNDALNTFAYITYAKLAQ